MRAVGFLELPETKLKSGNRTGGSREEPRSPGKCPWEFFAPALQKDLALKQFHVARAPRRAAGALNRHHPLAAGGSSARCQRAASAPGVSGFSTATCAPFVLSIRRVFEKGRQSHRKTAPDFRAGANGAI
jgi:hypothetical protein